MALTNHPTDEILKVIVEAGDEGDENNKDNETTTLEAEGDKTDKSTQEKGKSSVTSEVMEITPDHPVYVEGKGWVWAENLVVGDRLCRADGGFAKVLAVERVGLDEPQLVYNFTVKGPHTYFVLEVGVLVHNAGGCDPKVVGWVEE